MTESSNPMATAPDTLASRSAAPLLVALFGVGAAVSIALGVYGHEHDPSNRDIFRLGFSGMPNMKIWLGTLAVVLGLVQLATALWMWGKLPLVKGRPSFVAPLHRWSGTAAFVATVPVAYHCLWSIGFNNVLGGGAHEARRLVHSLAGCIFYGAFTTKMLVLRARRTPGWLLPIVGGLAFTALVVIWTTSSFWWFTNEDFPAF
jgi:hypothetical protein